jgi:hypothetical protein
MHQHIYRNINYDKLIIELLSVIMGLNTSDIYKDWTNNLKVWDNILELFRASGTIRTSSLVEYEIIILLLQPYGMEIVYI